MSRDFTKNTANLLTCTAGGPELVLAGSSQISFSIWGWADTASTGSNSDNRLFSLVLTGTSDGLLAAHDAVTTAGSHKLRLLARSQSTDGLRSFTSTSAFATGTGRWNHYGGAWDFPNDLCYPYLNGASGGSGLDAGWGGTTFGAAAAFTNAGRIGASTGATTTNRQYDGRLAHLAFWNTMLNANEFAALAAGVNPLRIRPDALKLYWPIWGIHSPEIELINNQTATISGTINRGTNEPPVEDISDVFPMGEDLWELVTAQTYDESISAGITTGLSLLTQLEAAGSISIPVTVTITPSGLVVHEPSISLAVDVDYTNSDNVIAENTVAFGATMGYTPADTAEVYNSVSLGTTLGYTTTGTGVLEASLALGADLDLSFTESYVMEESVQFSISPDIAVQGGLLLEGTIALGTTLGYALTLDAQLFSDVIFSFGAGFSVDSAGSDYSDSITLHTITGITTTDTAVLEASSQIGTTLNFTTSAQLDAVGNVTYGVGMGFNVADIATLGAAIQVDTVVTMETDPAGSVYEDSIDLDIDVEFNAPVDDVPAAQQTAPNAFWKRRRRP